MQAKDRQPPRFVPTLTEVVLEKESVSPEATPSSIIEGTVETEHVFDNSMPSHQSGATAQTLLPGAVCPSWLESIEPAVSLNSELSLMQLRVQQQVAAQMPALLEPLWIKFQAEVAQTIDSCVQDALAQELAKRTP